MYVNITRSKNIVHINTKAKRPQPPYLQEVWPFYSLTSVKDGIIAKNLKRITIFVQFILIRPYPNLRTYSSITLLVGGEISSRSISSTVKNLSSSISPSCILGSPSHSLHK